MRLAYLCLYKNMKMKRSLSYLHKGLAPSQIGLLTLLVLTLLGGLRSEAQITQPLPARSSEGVLRKAFVGEARTAALVPTVLRLPELRTAELPKLDTHKGKGFRTYQFALERPLDADAHNFGEYLVDGAGNYVWRAELIATGAKNVSLCLSRFALPEGGRLFITGAEGDQIGALTSQNNAPDSLLQLRPLEGNYLRLEYDFPMGYTPERGELPFQIQALFHGFRSWRAEPDFAHPGEPFYDYTINGYNGLTEIACIPNVLAYPSRWKETRSVVQLMVGGSRISSGVLINTTRSDGTPYVLTSGHCVNQLFALKGDLLKVKKEAATTVFFFNFQTPQREGNIRATEEQSLSGAELVAYNEDSDMALLRIVGLPASRKIPEAYQPYFAGWSIEAQPRAPFFGIHHPLGSTKRYSEAADRTLSLEDYCLGLLCDPSWEGKHWMVHRWKIGSTAAGSSGSPLFDGEGRIIGALTGGSSNCSSPTEDAYWAIKEAWRKDPTKGSLTALQPWLDPSGTGQETCAGYDPIAPKVIQRISHLYPDPNTPSQGGNRPNHIYQPTTSTEELGSVFTLPESRTVRVLGAYVVFKSNKDLARTQLPQLRIALSPFRGDGELTTPLFEFASTNVGKFSAHEEQGNKYVLRSRTLRQDSIEVFFPAPTTPTLTLPEGQYILSCGNKEGGAMRLPVLMHQGGPIDSHGWSAWTRKVGEAWQRSADVSNGAYWIDLLIETSTPAKTGRNVSTQDALIHAYYHDRQLHIKADLALYKSVDVRIYSMLGEEVLRARYSFNQDHLTLPLSLPSGQYVATVVPTRTSTSEVPSRKVAFSFILP